MLRRFDVAHQEHTGERRAMKSLLRSLIALVLLAPGQVLSDRALKDLKVGEPLPTDEAMSVGPRAVRLPQANWQLIALARGEIRSNYTGSVKTTTGIFAYIEGTRALAFIRFSATEDTLAVDHWRYTGPDCAGTPVRYRDRFGSAFAQPECHEVRLSVNFLG